ncbi:conserved protein of unknown function [Petrocella atlantisensis]|uniref:Uncharacterized protein n=1 Tax=Petrocella atlantisensis TaxID=2173034 RepID=A0A3P7P913_9FIRM|nr:DUF6710 family protein [Petrocella atlantisensis]VDN46683.1 conserved protein of unknown function [Petrocella atlantisensis]
MILEMIDNYYNRSKYKKFNQILKSANEIINENRMIEDMYGEKCKNHPIFNFIRLLGRSTQTEYLQSLFIEGKGPKQVKEDIFINVMETINIGGKEVKIFDLIERIDHKGSLKLGRDLILPWPWNYNRYCSALCNFGSELHSKEWKEDKINHCIELWLPVGVAFVHGGNHSITAGIIQAEGEVTPYQCVKMDKYYDYIYTDGVYYREIQSCEKISKVESLEFAAIYEIGRLILKNDIKFNL